MVGKCAHALPQPKFLIPLGRSISQSVHILILRCWDQFWNGKLIKGTWAHQPGFKDMYI